MPSPALSRPDDVTWGSADEMLDDAGTAWGAIGAGAGAALKPARHLLRLSPCCPCRFVVAAKTITQQHIHVPMSHHRFRLPMHGCGSKSASGKAAPMLEEPPRALLRSEVPGDCPLGGPITGLAAALGFPHAFAGGAGAAFSALAYLGGCTTGPIPSELDIWGCLGDGPCTWTQLTPLTPAFCALFSGVAVLRCHSREPAWKFQSCSGVDRVTCMS